MLEDRDCSEIYKEIYEAFNEVPEIKLTESQVLRSLEDVEAFKLCRLHGKIYDSFDFKNLIALPPYEVIHNMTNSIS